MGTVVELYPTRGRKVFASQVYDIAYPDIVALDMKCKEVVVMEMTKGCWRRFSMWMGCWWPRRTSRPGARRWPATPTLPVHDGVLPGACCRQAAAGRRAGDAGGLGVSDADGRAPEYARKKQALIDRLIAEELRSLSGRGALCRALHVAGLRLALASSSKNVAAMLRRLSLPDGRPLLSIFDADLSGTDVPRGKPDPALFLLAAKALDVPPAQCLVVEDAPAGIAAARAGAWPRSALRGLATRRCCKRPGPIWSSPVSTRSIPPPSPMAYCAPGPKRRRPLMHDAMQPRRDPGWVLTHEGYNVLTENAVESRFALGNGFLGMRASRPVSRGPTGSAGWAISGGRRGRAVMSPACSTGLIPCRRCPRWCPSRTGRA